MNSLFKNVSKKLQNMTTCEVTLMVTVGIAIGYYLLQYLQSSGALMRVSTWFGNNNKVDRNKKEHFENGEKSDEYYGNRSDALLVTFYSFDYCGYCKKFQPIWYEAERKEYSMKVKFRHIVANKLTVTEKQTIPYLIQPQYAPCVILTYNGKNVKEFDQQMNKPLRGLDEFIESKGEMNAQRESKHL